VPADLPPRDPVTLLTREARSLVQRLRLWTPQRWAAAAPPYASRGELVHHLAQSFADAAAALEGESPRVLPRLDSDLALPDQLAVTADDLVRAGPSAEQARRAGLHLLAHRSDLLGDEVPSGLAAALSVTDAVSAGREICDERGHQP
jgi:hypothetical protein